MLLSALHAAGSSAVHPVSRLLALSFRNAGCNLRLADRLPEYDSCLKLWDLGCCMLLPTHLDSRLMALTESSAASSACTRPVPSPPPEPACMNRCHDGTAQAAATWHSLQAIGCSKQTALLACWPCIKLIYGWQLATEAIEAAALSCNDRFFWIQARAML
jgi:hypothetical protein